MTRSLPEKPSWLVLRVPSGAEAFLEVGDHGRQHWRQCPRQLIGFDIGDPMGDFGIGESTYVRIDQGNEALALAVPLPVVSRLDFVPPLPPDLVDSLAALPMGTAAKFVAPTESAPRSLALPGPAKRSMPCAATGRRVWRRRCRRSR